MFLNQTHLNLGYCFDTGHANLMGGVGALALMQTTIAPCTSTITMASRTPTSSRPWPKAAPSTGPRSCPCSGARQHQYPLLLELKESPDFPQPLESIPQIFKNLESL